MMRFAGIWFFRFDYGTPGDAGAGNERAALARRYARLRRAYAVADIALAGLFVILMTAWGTGDLYSVAGAIFAGQWGRSAAYIFLFFLVYRVVMFPFHYQARFRLEHRFGLSNQTFRAFLMREAKTFLVAQVIVVPSVVLIYALLRVAGQMWWLYAAAFYIALAVVMGRLFPVLVFPLFYRKKRIRRSGLIERLSALAEKADFSVANVYSFDLSRESRKLTAALIGLGRSRQVLISDTLMKNFDDEEIAVVFAHELGHHVMGHYFQMFIFASVASLVGFYFAAEVTTGLIRVFDIETAPGIPPMADVRTLPLLCMALAGFAFLVRPLQNFFSRKLELDSDRYALASTGDNDAYIRMFETLARQNLAETRPGGLATFLFYDHPPIEKRLALAREPDGSEGPRDDA